MRQDNHTQISSKGWTLDKAEKFVNQIRNQFSQSPVRVKKVRAGGKVRFFHMSLDIRPLEDADIFVRQMERDFGFTESECVYLQDDTKSVNMTIQIMIDNSNG